MTTGTKPKSFVGDVLEVKKGFGEFVFDPDYVFDNNLAMIRCFFMGMSRGRQLSSPWVFKPGISEILVEVQYW